MSVNVTIMLALGAVSSAMMFLIGRYFVSMTPERAAEIWKDNLAARKEVNLFGKIMMISAPLIFGVFAWAALSGMVE